MLSGDAPIEMKVRLPYPLLVMTAILLATHALPAHGQIFQELYSFTAGADGLTPQSPLIQGQDGNFYGTTTDGPGPITENWDGYGTIFRMTPSGTLTTLFAFNWTNGAYPSGALLQAADGNFYGTTTSGGVGRGTMFRISPTGVFTLLGVFAGGSNPLGDLVQGPDGFLYGVTEDGGDYNSHGTVFRASTNGWSWDEMSIYLHLFYPGSPEGYSPSGGLLLAKDGNFYGVTGGDPGAIYRVTTNGTVAAVASFQQGPGNAVWPVGKLLQADDGNFYGAAGGGLGTIFRLTPKGTLSTFARIGEDYTGEDPVGGLVQARDGKIYGCTYEGGWDYSGGGVFRMDTETCGCTNHAWTFCGNLNALFRFGETASGWHPYAGLVQGADGNLYGTTALGGSHGAGNIFRIIMPGPLLGLNAQPSAPNQIVLSWRTNYTGFTLQSAGDPISTNWFDYATTPTIKGGQFFVTNPISGPARFFRLKK
jgi:uncharacterized repeat protein (TIGR03803 family)